MADIYAPEFTNEEAAIAHLEQSRWPDGAVCPHCGSVNATKMAGQTQAGYFQCNDCREPFTVTVGRSATVSGAFDASIRVTRPLAGVSRIGDRAIGSGVGLSQAAMSSATRSVGSADLIAFRCPVRPVPSRSPPATGRRSAAPSSGTASSACSASSSRPARGWCPATPTSS